MNALVTITPAPTAGPHGAGGTILTARRKADFLASLQLSGNVRLACRAASVSAQTAYRARRASAAFARAWDAALLAARDHAEQVLADRALNGVEEPVFYHGEEIARRRRYSDRLLLAHLARLDRLAERAEVAAALPLLDEQIGALRRGEELPEPGPQDLPENHHQDSVPCVPSCRVSPRQTSAPAVQAECPDCGGACADPRADLGPRDCQWLGNRLQRMENARPRGAAAPHAMALPPETQPGDVEYLQLEAFEAGVGEWWTLCSEEDLAARLRDGTGRGAAPYG